MKNRIFGALTAVFLAFSVTACTAEQTEEGELPNVDVEGGNMPEYDVDPVNVDVGTDTQTVIVPDVNITADTTPR